MLYFYKSVLTTSHVRGSSPASVGSAIEDLVCLLHHEYGVRLVCVGQTVKRGPVGTFNTNVQILAQYLQGVLEPLPFAIYWTHRGFWGTLLILVIRWCPFK